MKISPFKYFLTLSLSLLIITFPSCDSSEESDNPTSGNPPSNNLNVGASANDLLSDENFDQLIIEIQYAEGYEPPAAAVSNLKSFLQSYLNKPAGINITSTQISTEGKDTYTISELRAIEDNNRTAFSEGSTIAAYFFFADGGFSEDTDNSKVLGVAHRNTSMVLFQKTIADNSGSLGQPSTNLLTTTVMNHEFGHILGLVNNGTPMEVAHQDTDHGSHCNDENCLMYWTAETGAGIADLLGMSSAPQLDSQCQADLKANGGK